MSDDQSVRSAVLSLVAQIPRGKVSTYGAVARVLQVHPRQVGRVLHSNTNPDKYPCHRVIHADGSTAAGYVFGGPKKQQKLLEKEGVLFEGSRAVMDGQLFSQFRLKMR